MFYIYEWYNIDTNEIFYVGKGCKRRAGQKSKRNKLFKEYLAKNNCNYRIIEYFEKEEDALKKENERILQLKQQNQCFCNLDNGGCGGMQFVWTQELREYKSKYNPMKDKNQKERMSKNNPMKDKNIAQKVGAKHSKAVIINGIKFPSIVNASKYYNVCDTEVSTWLKRGYDRDKKPCRYVGQPYKQYTLRVTSSKPVIIDGVYYKSVKDASKALNCFSECIIRAIKGNRLYKGHTCKYGNQQPSYTNSNLSSVKGSTTNE